MSYLTISVMASNPRLQQRIRAAVVEQLRDVRKDAISTAMHLTWTVCAEPGWADAYKYAVDSGNMDPGGDEAVITDGMILAAVQKHLEGLNVPENNLAFAPPPEPYIDIPVAPPNEAYVDTPVDPPTEPEPEADV